MVCNSQHNYELDLSQEEEIELKIFKMTSLLNPLNKLEAVDNNSSKPNPPNGVDEDDIFINDKLIHEGK